MHAAIRTQWLASGDAIDAHRHDHQIVYGGRGVLAVTTSSGSWAAPPGEPDDSGGPAFHQGKQVGVLFGPGEYSSVAAHRAWIRASPGYEPPLPTVVRHNSSASAGSQGVAAGHLPGGQRLFRERAAASLADRLRR